MTGTKSKTRLDLDKAMTDPADVFDTPEALLADDRLSREQKAEVLRRWSYDANEAAVAGEEGMPGNESDLLDRILAALDRLGVTPDIEQSGPTKQRGITGVTRDDK